MLAGALAAGLVGCGTNPTGPAGAGASTGDGGHTTASGGFGGAEPCRPGFFDCDADAANGCETDTRSDVGHCGACAVTCESGWYSTPACVAGVCSANCDDGFDDCNGEPADGCEQVANSSCGAAVTTLAAGQGGPFAIALDESNVYWLNNNAGQGGEVMKVALAGGTPVILGTSPGNVQDLAVGPSGAYWTDYDNGVLRVDLGGGTPATVDSELGAQGIALDAAYVYWTRSVGFSDITRAPLSGGASTALASQQTVPWRIAVDDQNAYWTGMDSGGNGWVVMKVSLAGGVPEQLASGQGLPWGIAVDGTSVYWVSAGTVERGFVDGMIMKIALTDGQVAVLATDLGWPTEIAVDGAHAYWTNSNDGTVMRIALEGGVPAAVATQQPGPVDVAVDATHVYWANAGGSVKKAPK
jgi:hypothetical protein